MKKFTFKQLFPGFKFQNNGTGSEMEVISVVGHTATIKSPDSINKILLTKQMFDSLVKQGRHSRIHYVMVTTQFGDAMYIAEQTQEDDMAGTISVTDNRSEALLWDYEDTISSAKLPYHRAVTGWDGLHFEKVNN